MPRLKYRPQDDVEAVRDTLKFPGSVRDILSRTDTRRIPPDRIADAVGRTLDRMQEKVDALRREVDAAYRFPTGDDDRPAA